MKAKDFFERMYADYLDVTLLHQIFVFLLQKRQNLLVTRMRIHLGQSFVWYSNFIVQLIHINFFLDENQSILKERFTAVNPQLS